MKEGSQFHFIVAFTTWHARLKLYESLDTLEEQVLYYDTDTVIYKWKPMHSEENAVKGEIPTGVEGWLHGGAILVTVCFKSRFECPCINHSKVLGGWIADL